MTLLEAARKVIGLAREVHDYYAAELPRRHRHYPLVSADEESAPPPPAEKELRAFLSSLPEDTLYQLILIMYLGRGDFGVDDLAGYYQTLKGTFGDPEQVASQMTDKAPLADYLSDGLEELRKQRIDVNRMPLKKAKVRK
jgi:Protein of unknown function (DUF3775)